MTKKTTTADAVREAAAGLDGLLPPETPKTVPAMVVDRYTGPSILEHMTPAKRSMLRELIAPGETVTDRQLGEFVELSARYDLDPWAREIWLFKTKKGLMVFVGRDGVRKIILRNGRRMLGDAVFKNDTFKVRFQDGRHHVTHEYTQVRGELVGAWALVFNAKGEEVGYHYSTVEEAKPKNTQPDMPWDKSPSIMCRGNAERQAGRQSTPMGGLLVEGEEGLVYAAPTVDGVQNAQPLGVFDWAALPGSEELIKYLRLAIEEIEAAEPGSWSPAALQMKLMGRPESELEALYHESVVPQLNEVRARRAPEPVVEEPVEATVVETPKGPRHGGGGSVFAGETLIGTVRRAGKDSPDLMALGLDNKPMSDGTGATSWPSLDEAMEVLGVYAEKAARRRVGEIEIDLNADMLPDDREALVKEQAALWRLLSDLGVEVDG